MAHNLTQNQINTLWLLTQGDTLSHSLMTGWTVPCAGVKDHLTRHRRALSDREAGELADMGYIDTKDTGPSRHWYEITPKGEEALFRALNEVPA